MPSSSLPPRTQPRTAAARRGAEEQERRKREVITQGQQHAMAAGGGGVPVEAWLRRRRLDCSGCAAASSHATRASQFVRPVAGPLREARPRAWLAGCPPQPQQYFLHLKKRKQCPRSFCVLSRDKRIKWVCTVQTQAYTVRPKTSKSTLMIYTHVDVCYATVRSSDFLIII
jgi:hypothetical protein